MLRVRKNLSKKRKNLNELDTAVADSLYKWRVLDSRKQGKQARHQAQLTINKCKSILKGRSRDEQLLNKALIYGVFFRGLQDYNDLAILTHLPDWNQQPELIEKIWNLLCDCEDRMKFTSFYIKGPIAEMVLSGISRLEKEFKNLPELYGSVCFDGKRVTCSICHRDFRSCWHIRGHIYAGACLLYTSPSPRD